MTKVASIAVGMAALCFAALASGGTSSGRIVFAATMPGAASGHIYVVPQAGPAVDLSATSGGDDLFPTLSPDGTHIAFLSTRGGRPAIYTMSLDGSNLTRVSPHLGTSADPATHISWQRGGRSFAVISDGEIYSGSLTGDWRTLVRASKHPVALVGWSPDGTLLTYLAGGLGLVQTVDSSGAPRFASPGVAASWSAQGRLAVERSSSLDVVFSEAGKRLGSFAAAQFGGWSPDGSRFADLTPDGVLQVRKGGVGSPVFTRDLGSEVDPVIQWFGNDELVFYDTSLFALKLSTGARVPLPAAFDGTNVTVSPDGSHFAGIPWDARGNAVTIVLSSAGGGARTVATHSACPDGGPFWDLQFTPGNTLVYSTNCDAPSAQIYAVEPDGSGLTHVLTSNYDDDEPSVSPDGSKIAFVRRAEAGNCHGCEETVWVMNADGTGARSFPNSSSDSVPYDNSPSFSPNGKTILFTRGGFEWNRLYTVPAAGGTAKWLGISGYGSVQGPARIAYLAGSSGAAMTAKPDGTGKQTVAVPGWNGSDAMAWSADGRLAVFQPGKKGAAIVIVGTGKRIPLTSFHLGPLVFGGLAWSPNGQQFAFIAATAKDPAGDVYTVGVDGSHLTQVTHGAGAEGSLSWR